MEIEERERITREEWVYLPNGLKAHFCGWKAPGPLAGIHSAMPRGHLIAWDEIPKILARPDRRITRSDMLFRGRSPWLGLEPEPEDFATPEDYERVANGPERWW